MNDSIAVVNLLRGSQTSVNLFALDGRVAVCTSDRLRWCRNLTSELQIEALSANFWPRYRDPLLSYASFSLLRTL